MITRVEPAVPSSEHIAQDLLIGDAGRAHVAVKGIGLWHLTNQQSHLISWDLYTMSTSICKHLGCLRVRSGELDNFNWN